MKIKIDCDVETLQHVACIVKFILKVPCVIKWH